MHSFKPTVQEQTLVSVIIPFFNAEEFIEETIESVFAQTYGNWELLLVDDGSTDGSTEIALRHARLNPGKVRYYEHKGHLNRGTSASRNLGIDNAKGEYLAFLDSDDVWLPRKLERQIAIMNSQPEAGMLYGATLYWHGWTGNPEDAKRDYIPKFNVELDTLIKPPTLFLLNYPLGAGAAPCPCDLFIRRRTIERVGRFEESFTGVKAMYEDQAFLSKVYLHEPVFVASECWDKYRIHPKSCMATGMETGQYHAVRSFFLNWLEGYFVKQQVSDAKVLKALEEALYPYRHPMRNRLAGGGRRLRSEMKDLVKATARRVLPAPVRRLIQSRRLGADYIPPPGQVRLGDLRRLTPVSRQWGFDRGLPIDRYYIEKFLGRYADDIRGRVLEVKDATYTKRFGGARVTRSDVLDVIEDNPQATIIADLNSADHIPPDSFDCIILTQTLLLIYDVRAALRTVHRILKPGGVLLMTLPSISQIARDNNNSWEDYWRFTDMSARRLCEEFFTATNITVETYGNVLAATAFINGLSASELRKEELDHSDFDYQITVAARAVKAEASL